MITTPPDVVQQTATIVGFQLNPMYSPTGTLMSIRVIAMGAGNIPVPNWAQPNRRQPTATEMAAIVATPMLPGEVQIPAWLDRAALPFMQTVYSDLLSPVDAAKGPREIAPPQPPQRPQPSFQAPPNPRSAPQRGQRPQLHGQQQPVLPPGMPRPQPPGMQRPGAPPPQGGQTMPSPSAQLAPVPVVAPPVK